MASVKSDIGEHEKGRLHSLFRVITELPDEAAARRFLEDLCTPAELRSMADRWHVARLLHEGMSYRNIYERTGVSTATVTRVSRAMSYGSGGYRQVLGQEKGKIHDSEA